MLVDPEYLNPLRKKLTELVNQEVSGLVKGSFPDVASMERQRGIIVGLGMALDLISPITTDTRSEETDDKNTG